MARVPPSAPSGWRGSRHPLQSFRPSHPLWIALVRLPWGGNRLLGGLLGGPLSGLLGGPLGGLLGGPLGGLLGGPLGGLLGGPLGELLGGPFGELLYASSWCFC